MSRLGWTADGIERARAAGGLELELYRRPGFTSGMGVRRSETSANGFGVPLDPQTLDPDLEEFDRRAKRHRR